MPLTCPHCGLSMRGPVTVAFKDTTRRESYRCLRHGLQFGSRTRNFDAEDAGAHAPWGPMMWDEAVSIAAAA